MYVTFENFSHTQNVLQYTIFSISVVYVDSQVFISLFGFNKLTYTVKYGK